MGGVEASTKHLCRFFISHLTQSEALPPRGIDSAHRKGKLVGISRGKGRLEFSGRPTQLVSPLATVAAARPEAAQTLEGRSRGRNNVKRLYVPCRYAQTIALRSYNMHAQAREPENKRKAVKRRVKVTKRCEKRCRGSKFNCFCEISASCARFHALIWHANDCFQ